MILKGQVTKTFKLGDAEIYYKEPSALKITKEVYEFTGKKDATAFAALESDNEKSIDFCMLLLKKIITGWKGIQDEDGNEIPFNQDLLEDFETDDLMKLMKLILKIVRSKMESKAKGDQDLKNS
jgi:hypothetical protein